MTFSINLIFYNAYLRSAQDPAVELEALLLHIKHSVVLLVLLVCVHEQGLMLVGVEFLADGIEALQAVFLERVHKDGLRHLEALVQVGQILQLLGLFLDLEFILRDHGQRAVQVVHAVYKVLGEALNREFAGVLDVALGAILQVTEVGNGTEAFVLKNPCQFSNIQGGNLKQVSAERQTFQSTASFSLVSNCFLHSVRAGSSVDSVFCSSPSVLASVFPSLFSLADASLYHLTATGCILCAAIGVTKVCGRHKGFW